jgi:hypothetical protein
MINFQLAFFIAVTAVVYSYILTRPNALLNGFYNWAYVFFKTDERSNQGRPFHPLFMVLIHCEKCVAGQAALWLYLISNWHKYHFLQHVFFTAFTIIIAGLIKNIYTKTEQ